MSRTLSGWPICCATVGTRASFIPPAPQRHLRDLTRYRIHRVDERARLTNRLQAVLEDANSQLASVVTDVRGLSAREILQRLLGGETDSRVLAELARGKRRAKRDALAQAVVGRLEAHHIFLLREQLAHLEYLDAASARLDAELEERLAAEREAVALLATIPGVAQRTAEVLVAAIGTDLSRFPSAQHRASWAGGWDVPRQCRERRPAPQRPNAPRERLVAAHTG